MYIYYATFVPGVSPGSVGTILQYVLHTMQQYIFHQVVAKRHMQSMLTTFKAKTFFRVLVDEALATRCLNCVLELG